MRQIIILRIVVHVWMLLLIRGGLGERSVPVGIFTEVVLFGCPKLLVWRVEALVVEDVIVSALLGYVLGVMGADTHNLMECGATNIAISTTLA